MTSMVGRCGLGRDGESSAVRSRWSTSVGRIVVALVAIAGVGILAPRAARANFNSLIAINSGGAATEYFSDGSTCPAGGVATSTGHVIDTTSSNTFNLAPAGVYASGCVGALTYRDRRYS